MASIRCENCGCEVKLPERSSVVVGTTISKESKGEYVMPMERDSKGRFIKKTNAEKENNTMKTTNNKTTNNGGNNMNGFDMEQLAQMVAGIISGNTEKKVSSKTPAEYKTVANGGQWAKGSKYYGKEIAGYVFNPYMVRWHLQRQYEELCKDYEYNVHKGISETYDYMYSVRYTLEEVRKLAMLEKRDRIAFAERSKIFPLNSCKTIFVHYIDEVIKKLSLIEREMVRKTKVGNSVSIGFAGYGFFEMGTVSEKIKCHEVVKYMEQSDSLKSVYADLERLRNKLKEYYGARTYDELYKLMCGRIKNKINADTRKSRAFMNCFIKAGAYYTLKQKLMFDETVEFRGYKGKMAVDELRRELNNGSEGYQFHAMLKKVMGEDVIEW